MVAIIDYGMGNVGSVGNALKALGCETMVSSRAEDLAAATHLILPGVGAFGDGMKNLAERGLIEALRVEVFKNRKPILGLCLGLQLMAEAGEEGGEYEGLGWLKGRVRRFTVDESRFRIPLIGWNDVAVGPRARLFAGVKKPIFYFAHSFHFAPHDASIIAAEAEHGERFVAAVESENIFGLQFHPEKSQQEGLKVLQNFLEIERLVAAATEL